LEDTIAAIATPPGMGGIGIIRVSGPKSRDIALLLFRSPKNICDFKTHHLYHGDIVSPETGSVIDVGLICLMAKPHSYTGEDTLEINCHGGSVILQKILSEVLKAGVRIAEPGEFTKRAFLNDRIDLSQAEAILDMITAKTEKGLDLALAQFKGDLTGKIEDIHSRIIDALAMLEASIDFSDEDMEGIDVPKIADTLQPMIDDLGHLASTYQEGKIYREGISAVITGRPNVGKSSLLNRLLGEKRAIVTPIPGTTRDFIEEMINIEGIAVRLTDTAGIRNPENLIEQEGIHLVREKLASADIVIVLLDGSTALTEEDITLIKENTGKNMVLVINKTDIPSLLYDDELKQVLPDRVLPPIRISAKYGDGINNLRDSIRSLAMNGLADQPSGQILTNIRHKTAIENASILLSKARDGIHAGLSPEFAALDVREALDCLGEIAGKTLNEDVLDRIFSTFCIGK
jgi:tRNA modification GTPase